VLTIDWKHSVMHRLCVTWTLLMGAWTSLAEVSALGAEPIRHHPLPVSHQAWSTGTARVVSDSPHGNSKLRTEDSYRAAETPARFSEGDIVREGYLDEQFLPPAAIRAGLSRSGDPDTFLWTDDGIVDDRGVAPLTKGLAGRSPVCAPRCPPRHRAVRVRKCATSHPVIQEEEWSDDLAPVTRPPCRCTRCRQVTKGCRCRGNRPVCPPERARLPRSEVMKEQAFDKPAGVEMMVPRDEFAPPGTESHSVPTNIPGEFAIPAWSGTGLRRSPTATLPVQPRPQMRPTPAMRPVAVSPRPRHDPVFDAEAELVPELSLPE